MSRIALSLLLILAMAPTAQAEGTRSLGVTVSPLGAFAVTRLRSGVVAGMSGGVDWDFRNEERWVSMGGHLATSSVFTEATPLRVRVGPQWGRFHPYAGAGLSLLLPWDPQEAVAAPALRMGGELSAGASYQLSQWLFMSGEGRYQNFSYQSDPFSSSRQELLSVYLGVGFRL